MGFFSWKTSDTKDSIPSTYQDIRKTFTVHMILPDGTRYTENAYEGFGVFGEHDFYTELARINLRDTEKHNREFGLELAFSDKQNVDFPKLVRLLPVGVRDNKEFVAEVYKRLPDSEECEYQGYFYDR